MEPLKGVRVMDASRLVAGSGTTRTLAAWGAEVIKVEWPDGMAADNFRDGHWNLDKLSCTLNMKHPKAMEVAQRLMAISDIFVENYRPRVMKSLGMDYESVRQVNPGIIYLSMSGWGQDGPRAGWSSYGGASTAQGGLSALAGLPGERPSGFAVTFGDENAPWVAGSAIMAAIHHKRRTGQGQYIDMAQTQVNATMVGTFYLDKSVNGRTARRPDFPGGNDREHPMVAPHNTYACRGKDAWVAIAAYTDEEWASLKSVMGDPGWACASALDTAAGRYERRREIDAKLGEWTAGQERYTLAARLQAHGVPASVVQSAFDHAEYDPQLAHRGTFRVYHSPVSGPGRFKPQVPILSKTPYRIKGPIPAIGQDSDYVFRTLLGYSEAEIAALAAEDVIKAPAGPPRDGYTTEQPIGARDTTTPARRAALAWGSGEAKAPLDDLLVLELGDEGTQYAGRLLGELGARVLKIEPPGGAASRHRGPFKDDRPDPDGSLYFWAYNTNKESIVLDLETEAGRDRLRALAEQADIVLEDFRPGWLDSIGLGYGRLSQRNPRLIMTSVTPFGQTGPWKDWKGGDLIHWAAGSILFGSGYDDGQPLYPQGDLSYVISGHHTFLGTMTALMARDVSGEGQQVDVSIQESCSYVSRAYVREARGMTDIRDIQPLKGDKIAFKCADGKYIMPSAPFNTPKDWANLIQWFKSLGVGEHLWAFDEEAVRELAKKTGGSFIRIPGLYEATVELGSKYRSSELLDTPQKLNFTWVVYNLPDELLDDEQLNARAFFKDVDHPEHGRAYRYGGEPYKFSLGGWSIRRRPPLLGEHDDVLDTLTG